MDTRVAAYGVVIVEGKILLAHWRSGTRNGWTLPGGGINHGEHPRAAAIREIREETGLRATLTDLLTVDSLVIAAATRDDETLGPLHAIRIIYAAEVESGPLVTEQNGSTDAVEWVDLRELDSRKVLKLVRVGLSAHASVQLGHQQ